MRRHALPAVTAAAAIAVAGFLIPATADAAPPKVSAKAAQVKVLKKVRGQILGISPSKRDGFTSWAVKVKRADGSIVTGYVDAKSGIIFDWTVQEGPGEPIVDLDGPDRVLEPAAPPSALPSPTPTPTPVSQANTATLSVAPVARPSATTDDDRDDDPSPRPSHSEDADDDGHADDDASDASPRPSASSSRRGDGDRDTTGRHDGKDDGDRGEHRGDHGDDD